MSIWKEWLLQGFTFAKQSSGLQSSHLKNNFSLVLCAGSDGNSAFKPWTWRAVLQAEDDQICTGLTP